MAKKLSKETKQKISEGVKKNMPRTAFKKGDKTNLGRKSKLKGTQRKEETKQKISKKVKENHPLKGKRYDEFYGKKKTKEIKEKQRRNLVEKGNPHAFKKGEEAWNKGKHISEETRTKIKKARAKQILPVKDTKIEIKIQNFLKELKIEFFTHQYMKIEHGYQCDILIPSMDLVLECDGDYWHKYPIGNKIDHMRTSELIEKGFKVLRLWEHEINNLNLKEFGRILYEKK